MSGADRRAAGYRLLGRGFDYLLHLRPAEWPILTIHLLTGSALSIGLAGLLRGGGGWTLVSGTIAFVIGLNGGTLALNSAFDRDEGDIAYLKRPPPPPRFLGLFGAVLMAAGALLAAWQSAPRPFLEAYALCVVLSILYSVPPMRLKSVPGIDWVVNMAGFGLLTPYAGWALTGRDVAGPGRIVLISFGLLFGALYPLTQIYQLDEDARRGDRTLAVVLGLDRSLGLALVMTALSFGGLVLAASGSAWSPGADGVARWAALAVAAVAWLVVLLPWWLARRTMDPPAHQAGMHHALAAWAITDMAVLFAWAR